MMMDFKKMFPRAAVLVAALTAALLFLSACDGGVDTTLDETPAVEDEATIPALPDAPTADPFETPTPAEGAAPETAGLPSVTVRDQAIEKSTVTVPEVVSDVDGWLVIHTEQNGAPGPVIGQAPVSAGRNQNVVVEIDMANATETLYAMLHADTGVSGEYEFPDADPPVQANGQVVVQPFTVTSGPEGAAADTVGLELVAEGLTAPVVLREAPDDSGRLFVADQVGLIRVIDADGQLVEQPFLDLRDRMVTLQIGFDERGLLGMDFHPDYAANGRFFVYYSAPLRDGAPGGWDHTSHISEFAVSSDNAGQADPGSEQIILQVDQPQFNHDGGQIVFGPDGYLYIPLGDGGGANDVGAGHVDDWYAINEGGNGQNRQANLLGSILRIDVDTEGTDGRLYAIPEDNPFVGETGMEETAEIWAYGLRNPFRITFDMGGNQELFVGDAGQDLWEEVSIVTSGGNYGWNVKEGTHCFNTDNQSTPRDDCPNETSYGAPLIDPVIEYANANQAGGLGLAVIGGYVYRGSALPQFTGQYIFGDWSTAFDVPGGKLLAAARPDAAADGTLWPVRVLNIAGRTDGQLGHFLLSFGQDQRGELYVLTSDNGGPTGETGRLYRIVPSEGSGSTS